MWARRLGVPAYWPSRIKVIISSALAVTFLQQILTYMHKADATYLSLRSPYSEHARCRWRPGLVSDPAKEDPLQKVLEWHGGQTYHLPGLGKPFSVEDMLPETCPLEPIRCIDVTLPVAALQEELGRIYSVNHRVDPFEVWVTWFIVLSLLLGISILVHDLAMLQPSWRPRIFSRLGAKMGMPHVWHAQQAVRLAVPYHKLGKLHPGLWWACTPIMCVWQMLVFIFFIYPMFLVAFVFYPIRMSRIMAFISGILCLVMTVTFSIHAVVWRFNKHAFSLLWSARRMPHVHGAAEACVCYCQYGLNSTTFGRLIFMAIIILIGCVGITMRSLKGLRHSRWANLLSILYTVPVEVFPVLWSRPPEAGGGPIRHRTEGEPVQGEPAFDPFCLLDEQPESWRSELRIQPKLLPIEEAMHGEWAEVKDDLQDKEVRCCGFPRFAATDARHVELSPSGSDLSSTTDSEDP